MANIFDLDADEIIVTSSTNYVCAIDPKTGKALKSYKCNKIAPKCLTLLGYDYFIGAPSNVPDIKIWPVHEEKSAQVVSSPCGIVNALTVTHCGKFCVAAIKQEIRVWDVQCGEMLARFNRHYQDITCLRFTEDDSMFISGSKDGSVLVWNFERVCSVTADSSQVKPLYTWSNHSKEVTDIYISALGIWSRVATTSTDMTCKIYELDTGLLLATLCLDIPLTAVTMDSLEHHVIVGTQKGSIFKVNLYQEQPREIHKSTSDNEEVKAHMNAVSCLSCSTIGDKFLSCAVTDKIFKIWEIASLTCILAITSSDGPLTNAFFTQYPAPLLTRLPQYFNVSQLERDILPTQDKYRSNVKKFIKVHDRPLSLIHSSGIDEAYSHAMLIGKAHEEVMTASESAKTENLYQEAFRGETIDEVQDLNVQMYTYVADRVFENLEPPAHIYSQVENC